MAVKGKFFTSVTAILFSTSGHPHIFHNNFLQLSDELTSQHVLEVLK